MGNEGRLPADGADRVRDEAANVAGEAAADCAGQLERTTPTEAAGSVRNEAGDIEGAVVQAGSVYGGINLHLPAPGRVVDEKRRQERRERLKTGAQNTGALLMLIAFLTSSYTLPWARSVFGKVGPQDAPSAATTHVGDCAAWNARFKPDYSGGPISGGVHVLVKVPCWHGSALYRVIAIVPYQTVTKRGSDENLPLEAATKAVCRSEPGWDNGTYTTSVDAVFCLAHN